MMGFWWARCLCEQALSFTTFLFFSPFNARRRTAGGVRKLSELPLDGFTNQNIATVDSGLCRRFSRPGSVLIGSGAGGLSGGL